MLSAGAACCLADGRAGAQTAQSLRGKRFIVACKSTAPTGIWSDSDIKEVKRAEEEEDDWHNKGREVKGSAEEEVLRGSIL